MQNPRFKFRRMHLEPRRSASTIPDYFSSSSRSCATILLAIGWRKPLPYLRNVALARSGLTANTARYVGRQYFIRPWLRTQCAACVA